MVSVSSTMSTRADTRHLPGALRNFPRRAAKGVAEELRAGRRTASAA